MARGECRADRRLQIRQQLELGRGAGRAGNRLLLHRRDAVAGDMQRQDDAADWRARRQSVIAHQQIICKGVRVSAARLNRALRYRLTSYPFYYAALGELELRCKRSETADRNFRAAVSLARDPAERRFFERRIGASIRLPLV